MYGAQWSSLEFCGCLIIQPNDEGKSLVLKKDQDNIEGIKNDGKIDDKKGHCNQVDLYLPSLSGTHRGFLPPWLKNKAMIMTISLFFSVDIMDFDFLHFVFFQVQYIHYCWKHYVERLRRNFYILFYGSHYLKRE